MTITGPAGSTGLGHDQAATEGDTAGSGTVSRRGFLGFVLGGATLVAAAPFLEQPPAAADGIPTGQQPQEN